MKMICHPYQNPDLPADQRAADLLERMNLQEKMAQVNCIFPHGENWEKIKKEAAFGIGQVSTLDWRKSESLEAAAQRIEKIQRMVMEQSPHQIPAAFHMEGVGGPFLIGGNAFPSNIARGAAWDPKLEEKLGEIAARQELAAGITQVLAPVLDLNRDPRMGRISESYAEDPVLAGLLGAAFVKGIQETEVNGLQAQACAKHFLGFHASCGGIHGAHLEISPRQLREVYAKPFQAAISQSHLKAVMPCYSSLNGEPMSASREILDGLLRQEMGFNGLCIADYGAVGNVHSVQKLEDSFAKAGYRCMKAGMDLEAQERIGFSEELAHMFETGQADIDVLDQAVFRVLKSKFEMGLFEHPLADPEKLAETFYNKQDREVLEQQAEESIVLLENNGILPLQPAKLRKIAVIGPQAVNTRFHYGGYTHVSMLEASAAAANSVAGLESGQLSGNDFSKIPGTNVQKDDTPEFEAIRLKLKPQVKSLLEVLQESLPETEIVHAAGYQIFGADDSRAEKALELMRDADLAILCLGGKNGSCSVATAGEGVDAVNIGLCQSQEDFIQKAAQLHIPMVGLHMDGRPISSDIASQSLEAILEIWNLADYEAEAIVKVLTGEVNPGGKLPVTTARNSGQIPIYYSHPNGSGWHQGGSIGFCEYVDCSHKPRYPFGHGLSYTSFAWDDLKIEPKEVEPDQKVSITLRLTNTGARAGSEVVQLYVLDPEASMVRPVMELQGFSRVFLEPGQTKKIHFELDPSQLAFLDADNRWKIEQGWFQVLIGCSSEDICLQDSFCVRQDRFIEGKNRALYAQAFEEEARPEGLSEGRTA